MDNEGRVVNAESLKQQIFRGGVDPPIRIEVWKFLLGYYDYNSTYKERQEQVLTAVVLPKWLKINTTSNAHPQEAAKRLNSVHTCIGL